MIFKLAFKAILSRKWFSASVIILMTLSMFIITFGEAEANKLIEKLERNTTNKYGAFHAVVNGINQNEEDYIKSQKSIKHYGIIKNMGYTNSFNNTKLPATFGTMDFQAKEMGHIIIEKGRYPERNNEVTIESYLQEAFNGNAIGEKVKIKINNSEKYYKIVGVIKNYSSNWTTPNNYKIGKTSYPNVIFNNNLMNKTQLNTSALIELNEYHDFDEAVKVINDLFDKSENVYLNTKFFEEEFIYKQSIPTLRLSFIIISLFIILISLIYTKSVHFRKQENEIEEIFKSYGFNKKKIIFYLLSQAILLTGFGAIIFFLTNIFINGFIQVDFLGILSWLIILFCVDIIYIMKQSTSFFNRIYGGKESVNIPKKFVENNTFSWKGNLIIIVIVSIFIPVYYISNLIVEENTPKKLKNEPDFSLFAKQTVAYDLVNNYVIEDQKANTFKFRDVEKLEKDDTINYIEKVPYTIGTSLSVNERNLSRYLKSWVSNMSEKDDTYQTPIDLENKIKKLPIKKKLTQIPNVNYYVLNKKEWTSLTSKYKLKNKYQSDSILMFFPSINGMKEDKIKDGDSIKLERIDLDEKNEIKYKDWDLKVGKVINKSYTLNFNGIHIENSGLSIAIPERLVKKEKIFEGYLELYIYLKEKVSAKAYEKTQLSIKKMYDNNQESNHENKHEQIEKQLSLLSFINKLSNILIFSIIINLVIVLMTKLNFKLREKQQFNSVNKPSSLKPPNWTLWGVFKELFICFMYSFFIGLLFIYLIEVNYSSDLLLSTKISFLLKSYAIVSAILVGLAFLLFIQDKKSKKNTGC